MMIGLKECFVADKKRKVIEFTLFLVTTEKSLNLKYSPPEKSEVTGFQPLYEEWGQYKTYTYQMNGDTLVLRDVLLKLELKALR